MFFNHPMFTGPWSSPAFSPMAFGGISPQASWGNSFSHPMYMSLANWSMGRSSGWLGEGWSGFQRGTASGPREGGWSGNSGGYVVGDSGRLQVDFKGGESDSDSMVQYRTSNGGWKDLDRAKSAKGSTQWIEADPGSTVKFRIKTSGGTTYQAGTRNNTDRRDHGRTTATDRGVRLAFEDSTDSDFNDAEIEISNAPRLR